MPSGDIGFVGLGIMGKPMVRNLMKAGYSLTVYDITGPSIEEVATDGATAASSAKEVAQKDARNHHNGPRLGRLGGRDPRSRTACWKARPGARPSSI